LFFSNACHPPSERHIASYFEATHWFGDFSAEGRESIIIINIIIIFHEGQE
jgi:hypothetical protein